MGKGDGEESKWMEGRTRHVRVYLTEDEHALLRQAAAIADLSASRFSIEAIVSAARQTIAEGGGAGTAPDDITGLDSAQRKPRGRPKKPKG